MSRDETSVADDLVTIYTTLRRLHHLKEPQKNSPEARVDVSLFPKRFLLKLLDERLDDLARFAHQICEDLFKQIGGKAKTVDRKQLEKIVRQNSKQVDGEDEFIRYPEFDEYYHCCVHYLHDFLLELHWHEAEIDQLSESDSDYVAANLKHMRSFLDSRKLPNPPATKNQTSATTKGQQKSRLKKTPRSSLVSKGNSTHGRTASPTPRRRVRFQSGVETAVESEATEEADVDRRHKTDDQEIEDVHSILALDLLVYAIDIFVKQLQGRFQNWSSSVKAMLGTMLDYIFSSSVKIRAKQLDLVAKRIKIYTDVHLTVLDYMSEIKTTYLIDKTLEVVCAKDSLRILEAFKKPRIAYYVDQCLGTERNILIGLTEQWLQIFFGLLVCEINFPPVELDASLAQKTKDESNKSHENVLNLIIGWLQADDVIFGYARPSQATRQQVGRAQVEKIADQIHRPKIAANSSTLALGGISFASSSRILAQMDNMSEFMKVFISIASNRIRHRKQTSFFFEFIAAGLNEFYRIIVGKLRRQLAASGQGISKPSGATKGFEPNAGQKTINLEDGDINSMAAKIRCLKFVHIMTSVVKLVNAEARRLRIELKRLDLLTLELDEFIHTIIGSQTTKIEVAAGPMQEAKQTLKQ